MTYDKSTMFHMSDTLRQVTAHDSYQLNNNNGIYKSWKGLEHSRKLEIEAAYIKARNANSRARPVIKHIAKQCKVDSSTVQKIEE